jgi:Zn-dependent protease with chaperone function
MADVAHLYPPNPAAVPPDLTKPTGSYRFRVVIVLLCLIVFVGAYLTLTIGSAYTAYYCFSSLGEDEPTPASTRRELVWDRHQMKYVPAYVQTRPREEKPVFGLILGGVGSAFLFLFLVKGLFKRSRQDPGLRVEVTERDQPVLFAFIRQLCKDTGAPFPHRVFVTPDVNAAVSFQESLVNLVFPSRKNLIIGLGLVNRLNLTEFKAVLAHEFGHFSQNSMKLGSYVYTANRVIADVVYGRDWFDDRLGDACRTDIRIAIFAWGFYAILWTMRKTLDLMFRGINFAHASLSRQMEYNADLVAASVTGSDALVFALARLDFASDSLGQAWNDLTAAADHGRFTRDMYYHHTKAAEFLKVRRNDPKLGEVPPLPDDPAQTVQVFKPEDTSVPKMWATHPANHDREANVKWRYFRGPVDDRPAWELFENQAAVREAITRKVYEVARKVKPPKLEEPEEIQAFIDAEHAETTYNPRYHGLYENRYVKPGDLAESCTPVVREEYADREKLAAAQARLWNDEVKERMAAHKARHEEVNKLGRLAHGAVQLTGKDFEHRGRRFTHRDAARLLKEVEGELDKDYEWMHALDRDVLRVHYAMAAHLGEADAAELEGWYRFHVAMQDMHSLLAAHMRHVQTTLSGLSRQVPQEEFQRAIGALRAAHDTLREQLEAAHKLLLPPLKNMTAGDPVGPFLLSEPLIKNLHGGETSLDGTWINPFFAQMGEVIDKSARILFKSLGGLLALQERIAERWAAPPPATTEEPPASEPPTTGEEGVTAEAHDATANSPEQQATPQ